MRPSVRALLICCLVAVTGGYFLEGYQRQQRRYRAWQRDQQVHAGLAEAVRILLPDAEHSTLLQAVELLRGEVDLPIDLESRLADTLIGPRHLILRDGSFQGIFHGSLDDALEEILRTADDSEGVGYRLEEGRIVIRRGSDFSPAVLVREYETPILSARLVSLDEREITELITTCIDPDCWDDVGGPYTALSSPGAVTVAASSQIHRKIARMLGQLAVLPAEPLSLRPVAFLDAGYPYDLAEPRSKVLAALDQTGDFEYAEVPLKQFLGSISHRFQIPMIVASKKLEEAGFNLEAPVTFTMSGVSLRTFLRNSLGDLGLTYTLEQELMVITTPEDAGSRLIMLFYPVHDLIDRNSPQDPQDLLDVITSAVDPDTWEDVGGPGSLKLVAEGWLLVAQSQEEHEHLLEFLHQLRHYVPRGSRLPPELTIHERGARHIQSLLCQPAILDLESLSLDQFSAALQKRLGVQVALATRKLEEEAIDPSSIDICLDPQPQPLWRQLHEGLQVSGLSFLVRDECIQITTAEDAGSRLEREIVDVRDLAIFSSGSSSEQFLMQLIRHSVDPDTWEDTGGPGSITSFKDCLVIFQYGQQSFEIREFLSWLRAHRNELLTPAKIASLDKHSTEYQRLVALSRSSTNRWLAMYLSCALNPEVPALQPVWRPTPPGYSGGCIF
ncbi:MAG: hypothetical protein ACKVP0_20980 [Pirellulaceae bacterium]